MCIGPASRPLRSLQRQAGPGKQDVVVGPLGPLAPVLSGMPMSPTLNMHAVLGVIAFQGGFLIARPGTSRPRCQ